jgi:hypothetical protein
MKQPKLFRVRTIKQKKRLLVPTMTLRTLLQVQPPRLQILLEEEGEEQEELEKLEEPEEPEECVVAVIPQTHL